ARELAEVAGRVKAAGDELARAHELVQRADALSDEADCPLCGQSLGDAFEQVQHHRNEELQRAQAAVETFSAEQKALTKTTSAAALSTLSYEPNKSASQSSAAACRRCARRCRRSRSSRPTSRPLPKSSRAPNRLSKAHAGAPKRPATSR